MVIHMKRRHDVTNVPVQSLRDYLKRWQWKFRIYLEGDRVLMDAWR